MEFRRSQKDGATCRDIAFLQGAASELNVDAAQGILVHPDQANWYRPQCGDSVEVWPQSYAKG
jgi:hypothetical protein